MKCKQVNEKIEQYLLGDLGSAESESIRRHLEECEGCRAAAATIEQTLDLVRGALAATSSKAPEALSAGRKLMIKNAGSRGRRSGSLIFGWFLERHPQLIGAAALVAVAVTLFFVLSTGSRVKETASAKPATREENLQEKRKLASRSVAKDQKMDLPADRAESQASAAVGAVESLKEGVQGFSAEASIAEPEAKSQVMKDEYMAQTPSEEAPTDRIEAAPARAAKSARGGQMARSKASSVAPVALKASDVQTRKRLLAKGQPDALKVDVVRVDEGTGHYILRVQVAEGAQAEDVEVEFTPELVIASRRVGSATSWAMTSPANEADNMEQEVVSYEFTLRKPLVSVGTEDAREEAERQVAEDMVIAQIRLTGTGPDGVESVLAEKSVTRDSIEVGSAAIEASVDAMKSELQPAK